MLHPPHAGVCSNCLRVGRYSIIGSFGPQIVGGCSPYLRLHVLVRFCFLGSRRRLDISRRCCCGYLCFFRCASRDSIFGCGWYGSSARTTQQPVFCGCCCGGGVAVCLCSPAGGSLPGIVSGKCMLWRLSGNNPSHHKLLSRQPVSGAG
ncbi:unnamed protein product [Ectocarpus sp. 8 AP-2014]